MLELTKENYDQEVMQKGGVTVVDFWSESCEECMDIMPEIEALEKEYGDSARFCKVNIKGNRRLAIREQVMGLPAVLIYKDGEKVASFSKEFETREVKEKLKETVSG